MIVERTLAMLVIATLPLGALCCGMEAVATGDPGASGAPGAGGRPAAGNAGTAAPGSDPATATETTTSVSVGADSGSTADAAGPAICRASGAACTVTADCCPGLSCSGEDEDRRCN